MTPDIPARFRFPDGRSMNGWWMYKEGFKDGEKYVVERIVLHGWRLGRSLRSLRAAHIHKDTLDLFVKEGILKTARLKDLAQEVTSNIDYQKRRHELENAGGYLIPGLSKADKRFILNFDIAKDISEGTDNTTDPNEERYVVAVDILFDYIDGLMIE